jgi:hypothetical protein
MNKQKLTITSIFAIVAISLGAVALLNVSEDGYVYVQSDITKANPNLTVTPSAYTLATLDITETKKTVVLTVLGTVLSVGDPIDWIDEAENQLGFVPVTIELEKKFKDKTEGTKLKKGDQFTVYLSGIYEGGKFYLPDLVPQFEIGERVILHVGHDKNGPIFEDNGNYFVELGKYGKYTVVDDIAYNVQNKEGKSLDIASNEAN